MPSLSRAQQHAAGMAEHASPEEIAKAGPAVQQMAKSMSGKQLHDFASGSMKGKPEHVKKHKKTMKKSSGRGASPRGGNPY